MVASTTLRLSISCCTVWLLSASELVKAEVLPNSDSILPSRPAGPGSAGVGQGVDRLRIQGLDNGFQAAEQQVEIQGGLRCGRPG